ncbi:carboxylesterase family protein [Streptomyces sp. NBC_00122]|uniref:carboxylesterase family protein n=1 Tax=Streptomyces sp. NBC_00122 TaxID=2903623 RepID=UPI0038689F79
MAALLAMPRAAGLFGRAVAQSVQGTFFSPELASDIAAACAAELGRKPTVAGLSTVAPARLSTAGDAVGAAMGRRAERWGQAAHTSIPFSPVVDGDALPVTPWRALADGAGRDVELLVGHTRDEQRLLTALDGLRGQVTPQQAASALDVFGPARTAHAVTRAAGGRAHVYELTWPAPGMGGVLGACRGLDVPLVLGNLDGGQPALLIGDGPSPEAEALSARMRAAWTAFAAHGDPGWPAYDSGRRLVQVFDARAAVTAYPEETSRLIWRNHTIPVLPLTGR